MKYSELQHQDLFQLPRTYALAHCVSSDFALGAGIAVEFVKRFDMRRKLKQLPIEKRLVGTAVFIDGVFNLITKYKYWGKPTYDTITDALQDMKRQAVEHNVKQIAMPLIGCGLDKLEWTQVSKIIQETFADTDIEIVVCTL